MSSLRLFGRCFLVGVLVASLAVASFGGVATESRSAAFDGNVTFVVAGGEAETAGSVHVSGSETAAVTAERDSASDSARLVPVRVDVDPNPALTDEPVEIAVEVYNFGDDGVGLVDVGVEGDRLASRWIHLRAGESETITVTTSFEDSGIYAVETNDEVVANVTVEDADSGAGSASDPPSTPDSVSGEEPAVSPDRSTIEPTPTPAPERAPGRFFDPVAVSLLVALLVGGGMALVHRRSGGKR